MKSSARCPVDLSSSDTYFESMPHELLKELRQTRPVFWHECPDGTGYWAILKYSDIRIISGDADLFSSQMRGVFYGEDQSGLTGAIIVTDPPDHRKVRDIVDPPFSVGSLRRFEGFLRDKTKCIMLEAAEKVRCDFVYDLAAQLPLAAISEIAQIPVARRNELLEIGDKVIRASDNAGRAAALKALAELGKDIARTRTADQICNGDDLVSLMLRGGANGHRLSDDEFGAQFAQIAVAGNETTRTLLSNICLLFIERPELMRELAADPRLLPVAIEEFLRWITPIYYMKRTARRDTILSGQAIMAGDPVVMYYLSGNRDEDVFERPFDLDIRRKPNRHLSFGMGGHVCLGQFLARVETRLFLEEFLAMFSKVESDGKPVRLASNITNSWARIPIRLSRTCG